MRAVLAALALVALGCAHGPRRGPEFACPARGGPAWAEVATEHFTVASDLPLPDAERIARELESVREWVLASLFQGRAPEVPGRVRVVAFRTMVEFDAFAPPAMRAFLTRNALGESVIVMPGRLGVEQRVAIAHELAHHVVRYAYPRQPRWFAEGLAGLAEAVGDDPGGAPFGQIPPHHERGFETVHVTVRELLAWDGRAPDGRYHDTATVLAHYLLHAEPGRFAELERRLRDAEDPAVTWRAVFPEWDPATSGGPEALDRLLYAHGACRAAVSPAISLESRAAPVARPLSPGEVHATRLSLARFSRGQPDGTVAERAEMEEALAEDQDHVVALQVKAELERADPLPLARRAASAHPDDARAWLWLSSAARGPELDDERLRALERAVALAPDSPIAANNLAWNLLHRDRIAEALPLAVRAARLAPGDAAVLDTLAGVQEAQGRCVDALSTAGRALDLLPEGASDEARAPWLVRVRRLQAQCSPARAAAGG